MSNQKKIDFLQRKLDRKMSTLSAMIELYRLTKLRKDKIERECKDIQDQIDAIKQGQFEFKLDLEF